MAQKKAFFPHLPRRERVARKIHRAITIVPRLRTEEQIYAKRHSFLIVFSMFAPSLSWQNDALMQM
jgi:hypothetical protein